MTPKMLAEAAARASQARITSRAAELMVQHPEYSVMACVEAATLEEQFVYGSSWSGSVPVGILGCSPIKPVKP